VSTTTSGAVTILFTDLVESTEVISRAGDEQARAILRQHRETLQEAARAHGGRDVKWTGDGLMVSFTSTAAAVRAAVAMQRSTRGPVDGERLRIRVGINVGEALEDEADYIGASVVIARRLCDRAEGGQILCSDLVAGMLRGRRGFEFARLGELELKGIPDPVPTFEVAYDVGPRRLPARTPYVGRTQELSTLIRLGESARQGAGALALVAGEPGIGKTRIAEEVASAFTAEGGLVLWGACHEGEWSPPFGPFVQALDNYVDTVPADVARREIGSLAGVLGQLSAGVRTAFPDALPPPPVQPDEERYRLAEGVMSFLETVSERAPVLVVLDDLHWSDSGTVAMVRRVARAAPSKRLLVVGLYRASDLTEGHPFTHAVHELPRETEVQFVRLEGLGELAVSRLLTMLAEQDVDVEIAERIARETGGNPFFIRELLLHLLEEGALKQTDDGSWTAPRGAPDVRVPESVRQVLGKRLLRMMPETTALLKAAAAFDGPFRFDVVTRVAGLEESAALDALDEALETEVLAPGDTDESYRFSHALLRHALYTELNPSRRTRLHRSVADALRASLPRDPTIAEHAEIAEHFHRSREVGGADAGVLHAVAAAEHARTIGSFAEATHHYEIAIDLCGAGDVRRPRLQAALALVHAWALRWDDAIALALEAVDGIVTTEGTDKAADFLALTAATISTAGSEAHSWRLVPRGFELVGDRRDLTWAVFMAEEIFRRNAEPESLGVELDVPERRELNEVLKRYAFDFPEELAELRSMAFLPLLTFSSRTEVLEFVNQSRHTGEVALVFAGELRRTLETEEQVAVEQLEIGHIASAAVALVNVTRAHIGLGNLDEARASLARAWELGSFVPRGGYLYIQMANAQEELTAVLDEGFEEYGAMMGVPLDAPDPVAILNTMFANASERQFLATIYAVASRVLARVGRADPAVELVASAAPAIRAAPPWAINLPRLLCLAAETLWLTQRTEYVELIEDAIREKLIAPDFRHPSVDSRLSMAQMCALQGRTDEAVGWFTRSREVLDAMGARPLRAIVDHDEAVMHARRGNAEAAYPLIDAAVRQFREIGMPGWIRRATKLSASLSD
jgi:class 3 adenylate cyclase